MHHDDALISAEGNVIYVHLDESLRPSLDTRTVRSRRASNIISTSSRWAASTSPASQSLHLSQTCQPIAFCMRRWLKSYGALLRLK